MMSQNYITTNLIASNSIFTIRPLTYLSNYYRTPARGRYGCVTHISQFNPYEVQKTEKRKEREGEESKIAAAYQLGTYAV